MALIRLVTGRDLKLDPERAVAIYEVLHGLREPQDAKQEHFCLSVSRVFLNWRNETTPLSYIVERKDTLRAMYSGSKDGQMLERLLMRAGEE